MVRTQSTQALSLGSPAPDFALPEPRTGRRFRLAQLPPSPALVIAFISNHCPFVQHLRLGMAACISDHKSVGVPWVLIGSNDAFSYPDDGPDHIADEAKLYGCPYLYDADQSVAKSYIAACTPDFFVFDGQRHLCYRGQFDASRPNRPGLDGKVEVTGADLRAAVAAAVAGQPPVMPQQPSLGCNIKWKVGNEPPWFST